ncbi:MAG TPA: hypothetical protein VFS52_21630 [Steroidobacteraceae bacterium]|jgi:hypothetical protein|nr:hypothetical protein [Steroidobacteraceae bacterium]
MKFARWVFAIAGIYGVLLMTPMYFTEARIATTDPPAITHPEYYYGFIGVTLAWQLAFLLVARDPVRYRPLMPIAVVEKLTFGVAGVALVAQERAGPVIGTFAAIDLAFATLFVFAYYLTRGTN